MKRIYIFCMGVLSMGAVQAQITLTSSANYPGIGDSFDFIYTQNPSINVSNDGANQTWDLSGLNSGAPETFAYDTKSLIVLAVTINNGNNTLTKTFKRQGTSKGPLKADTAVLEQDFNQLLRLLFNDISKDSQVIDYLTGVK